MNMINNEKQLLLVWGAPTMKVFKSMMYKNTDCGAYINKADGGVVIGSIVEGVDWGTESHLLEYPFTEDQFHSTIAAVENEAHEIWMSTHGCEDCGPEDEETGYTPVNPNCTECGGEGAVI